MEKDNILNKKSKTPQTIIASFRIRQYRLSVPNRLVVSTISHKVITIAADHKVDLFRVNSPYLYKTRFNRVSPGGPIH